MADGLTLEKMKVEERLGAVERKVDNICVQIESQNKINKELTKGIKDVIKKHDDLLFGNGDAGMRIRLDRLEKTEENRGRNIKMLWALTIGFMGKVIYDLFHLR